MKEIISEYGSAIIAAIAAVCIIGVFSFLLFSDNGPAQSLYGRFADTVIGTDAEGKETADRAGSNNDDNLALSMDRSVGQLMMNDIYHAGEDIRVSELITADGSDAAVSVIEVDSPEGYDITDSVLSDDGSTLFFESRGTYRVRAQIITASGVRSYRLIYIGIEDPVRAA